MNAPQSCRFTTDRNIRGYAYNLDTCTSTTVIDTDSSIENISVIYKPSVLESGLQEVSCRKVK